MEEKFREVTIPIVKQIVTGSYIEQTVMYVADDGTEFDIKKDCEKYEKTQKAEFIKNNIKKIYNELELFHCDTWYLCKDILDFEKITEYYKNNIYCYDDGAEDEIPKNFPCWVGICINEDDPRYYYTKTLDVLKEEIDEFFNKFKNT